MANARKAYSRTDWLEAAKKMLIDSGIDDVKVDLIAKKMKITRGSFYWHFKSRQQLLDELLADWRKRNLEGIKMLRAVSDTSVPSVTDCIRFWINQEDEVLTFDMAMRVWGRKSREVARAINDIDDAWIDLLNEMFVTRGFDQRRAFARARIVYFHQMGYHTLDLRETLEERVAMIPLYTEILIGDVDDTELNALMQELLDQADRRKPRASGSRKKTESAKG